MCVGGGSAPLMLRFFSSLESQFPIPPMFILSLLNSLARPRIVIFDAYQGVLSCDPL